MWPCYSAASTFFPMRAPKSAASSLGPQLTHHLTGSCGCKSMLLRSDLLPRQLAKASSPIWSFDSNSLVFVMLYAASNTSGYSKGIGDSSVVSNRLLQFQVEGFCFLGSMNPKQFARRRNGKKNRIGAAATAKLWDALELCERFCGTLRNSLYIGWN